MGCGNEEELRSLGVNETVLSHCGHWAVPTSDSEDWAQPVQQREKK